MQTCIITWKIVYLERFGKIITLCILKKEGGKCLNTFDQIVNILKNSG